MSHFFAYLSRMKFIKRWGLMHNTYPENIQEHSLRVAMIAHALAIIRNRVFDGAVNPERAAVLALYHDASEVLTGDLPAPVKYFNPEIKKIFDPGGRSVPATVDLWPGFLALAIILDLIELVRRKWSGIIEAFHRPAEARPALPA